MDVERTFCLPRQSTLPQSRRWAPLIQAINIHVMVGASLTLTSPMQLWLANIVDPTPATLLLSGSTSTTRRWAAAKSCRSKAELAHAGLGAAAAADPKHPVNRDQHCAVLSRRRALRVLANGCRHRAPHALEPGSLRSPQHAPALARQRLRRPALPLPLLYHGHHTLSKFVARGPVLRYTLSFLARITPPSKTFLATNKVTWLVSVVNITMISPGRTRPPFSTWRFPQVVASMPRCTMWIGWVRNDDD
ncbi:Aste57867_2884 [Aphanomyces stellatus]|uniref:Aste57867_2884 protein n=1 Tax=Aphanomyces stellatus TaxID=120398 RepID=A0A485K991_9STRA|nr:hypothetical protein As57867_002876 [Aphanomyces stellatus]VFT80068.1 Aste57867_2884 [Aphanomyces stellatus]